MAAVDQVASRSFLKRGGAILISIGILSSMAVYLAHGWFHGTLLPSLGIGSAFGDAVGGFIIILFAYVAQRLASLAIFDDTHFGLLCSAQQLQMANAGLKVELSEVDKLASTDRLTGCWNRHRFDEVIVSEIDRLTRYGQSLSMLIVDIDHFKSVNDNHGHSVGDSVLVELVSLVRSGLRLSDSLTRWGGEEFVVLCPNTSLTTAVVLAERLREKVSQTPFGKVGALTVSIGVAECLVGEQWQQWLDRADAELYGAKRNGRNQVRFAPETPLRVASDDFLDHNLVQLSWRKAFESGHGGIDRDHQALFSIANDLLNAIVSGKPFEEIKNIVDFLVREVVQHFENEESILVAMGYLHAAEHAEIHRQLSEEVDRLAGEFQAGAVMIGPFFRFLAHDVIAKHMLGADREFFSIFQKAGSVAGREHVGITEGRHTFPKGQLGGNGQTGALAALADQMG